MSILFSGMKSNADVNIRYQSKDIVFSQDIVVLSRNITMSFGNLQYHIKCAYQKDASSTVKLFHAVAFIC